MNAIVELPAALKEHVFTGLNFTSQNMIFNCFLKTSFTSLKIFLWFFADKELKKSI